MRKNSTNVHKFTQHTVANVMEDPPLLVTQFFSQSGKPSFLQLGHEEDSPEDKWVNFKFPPLIEEENSLPLTGSETNDQKRNKIHTEKSISEVPTPIFSNEKNTVGFQIKDPL